MSSVPFHSRRARWGALVIVLCLCGLMVALLAQPAAAAPTCTTDCYVDVVNGNDANSGTAPGAGNALQTIQAAVNQVNAGGNVHVAAGTYPESVVVNKSAIIDGDGPATTIIDPATFVNISAGDVTIKDLTIQNGGTHGASITGSTALSNITFDNVHFKTNPARGLEIGLSGILTNLQVLNSLFDGNTTGIRMASYVRVEGLTIDNTTFQNHPNTSSGIGFYQANDGNNGYVKDLNVDNSTFTGNGMSGIYLEEAIHVDVHNSSFSGNARGVMIFDWYDSMPIVTDSIAIYDNTFTDNTAASVMVIGGNENGLGGDVDVTFNTFNQDVGAFALNWAVIDVRLANGFTHDQVDISDNNITFSGTYGAATANYGVKIRGGVDAVNVFANTIDGGSVGTNGGTPPTTGVYVATNVASTYGATKPASFITVSGNLINNFPIGVVVYDEVAAAYGGLPAGATLDVNRNDLSANSAYGMQTDDPTESDATCNWWGAADGPSGEGSGAGTAVSTQADFAPWLATSDLDGFCIIADLYISPNMKNGVVDGVPFDDQDILVNEFGTSDWEMFFDGSTHGITKNLTDFTFDASDCLLMVFNGNQKLGALFFTPHDVAQFCPTVPGDYTAGTFSVYLDGSDVGLTTGAEIIDALDVLPDGRLVISPKGNAKVPQNNLGGVVLAQKNDLLVFNYTAYGPTTTGYWDMYLDNTLVPGLNKENIISSYNDGGESYMTFWANFTVGDETGDYNDIVVIHPDYSADVFWDGDAYGYHGRIHGLHIK